MQLSTIINDIKKRILTIPLDEPVFIYIGVGTCAGLKNNNGILEPQNYHQYPPFLQHLKNKIVDLNLFIVLIDPMQEQPPYMVADKGMHWINYNDLHNNDLHNNDLHNNDLHNNDLHNNNNNNTNNFTSTLPPATASAIAYSLLQSVYTDPYDCYGDSTNITEELRELNKYVIDQGITLLYHDFTGRRNNLLAEYFDPEIKTHLNHVIYGMSARQDHGCYFDLLDTSSFFPVQLRLRSLREGGEGGSSQYQMGENGVNSQYQMGENGGSSQYQMGENRGGSHDLDLYLPIQFSLDTHPSPSLPSDRKRNCLLLFNIFNYIVNDSLNLIAQDAHYYATEMNDFTPFRIENAQSNVTFSLINAHKVGVLNEKRCNSVNTMINTQIEQVISTIKSDLTNHMLSLLRIIFRLIVGDEDKKNINIEHCFNFISKIHREKYLNLYNASKYDELFNNLIDYFSRDMDSVAKLKKHDLTGKEILKFITHGNKPYEWYANIKHFF